MGMFDFITSEITLPGDSPPLEYQTKDFVCRLERYSISQTGALLKIPEKEGYPPIFLRGTSGEITFGALVSRGKDKRFLKYKAYFDKGWMYHVERVEE